MTNTANEPKHPDDEQSLNDDSQTSESREPSANAPTPEDAGAITDGEVTDDQPGDGPTP